MEDVKVWAGLIGQFGVPLVITLWYFVYERPAQRKREEDILARCDITLKESLKAQREDMEASRDADRKHGLEIQKLAGDIHKVTTDTLVAATQQNTKEVEELKTQMGRALETFVRGKRGT